MKLSELKTGQAGIIVGIDGHGEFRRRITEMGFVRGKRVIVVKNAPLHDPIEYNIMGYEVSLRRDEAALLEVENVEYVLDFDSPHFQKGMVGTRAVVNNMTVNNMEGQVIGHDHPSGGVTIKVALVGNPNSGKTTLFNAISGLNEHTGNYSGVTVDATRAVVVFDGYNIEITDLPGTYSISPFSPEERFVRDFIASQRPDVVVNVVDGSNIERNLYLTTQLIDMQQSSVLAMNMYDEFLSSADKLDKQILGEFLGMAVVPTVGKRGRGVAHILQEVVRSFERGQEAVATTCAVGVVDGGHVCEVPKINYPPELERLIEVVTDKIQVHEHALVYPLRYTAIKIIEGQRDMLSETEYPDVYAIVRKGVRAIEQTYNLDIETLMTDSRYGFISGAMKECYVYANRSFHTRSTRIDSILTHKLHHPTTGDHRHSSKYEKALLY